MPNHSPYRTLPVDRRIALVTHDIASNRDSRNGYIGQIVARGGGFRPEKLRKWPPEQLAREVVRHNLETPHDELGLMIALYVELEPAIQIAFLDAAGVAHDKGSIAPELEPPFADAAAVNAAARGLVDQFGDDARRYLRTIALYNGDGWPGLGDFVAGWE
jgi:hypothetical protein